MHSLSVYIFKVDVNQQLYGQACWRGMQGLCAGGNVKFHRVELDS